MGTQGDKIRACRDCGGESELDKRGLCIICAYRRGTRALDFMGEITGDTDRKRPAQGARKRAEGKAHSQRLLEERRSSGHSTRPQPPAWPSAPVPTPSVRTEQARLGKGTAVATVGDAQVTDKTLLPQPIALNAAEAKPPQRPVATIQGKGTIAQVQSHHVVVAGADDQQYGFMRSQFPGLAFHEGDQVTFRAVKDTREIVAIHVLERKAHGFGGRSPCGSMLEEIVGRTGRTALKELVEHWCEEKRLEWYWITPRRDPEEASAQTVLDAEVIEAIREAEPNFKAFYTHQAKALEALRAGRHVLVVTPTASGKTYCYNPAVFQALQGDPAARALYILPLNALLEDQVGKLRSMAAPFEKRRTRISIDRLIGGLGREYRDRIQAHPPQILATNPEMLSWILQRSADDGWPDFFRNLRFVVLDEVHTYRSLLGLHTAGLVRRLLVACRRYGSSDPQFVLSSATVGAPEELAWRLTSLPLGDFEILNEDDDGSEQQQRHWMVLTQPDDAEVSLHNTHLHHAAQTLVDVLTVPQEDLNAILFAKSIRDVHFVYSTVKRLLVDRGREELVPRISKFAGALLRNEERSEIYNGLRDGSLRAVISTNALEAGIDIGKLDVCIIAGFPFHVMRLRQMAGRAGRQQEGAVIFIPHPTHVVDRFYSEDPQRLLTQPPETFVIDHENPYIARKHVVACAASMPGGVQHQELELFGRHLDRMIREAREDKVVDVVNSATYTARRRWRKGDPWRIGNMRSDEQDPYAICKAPADQYERCSREGCAELGQGEAGKKGHCRWRVQLIDRQYVYRDAHPGAIFEDREGYFYGVNELEDRGKIVRVEKLDNDTARRTFASVMTGVTIRNERGRRDLPSGATLAWGDVRVSREYSGFFEYKLTPRRRCLRCRADYPITVSLCPACKARTRPYLSSSRPSYRDFPGKYRELTYSIELETVACWLVLPSALDGRLEAVSACKIPGRNNRVTQLLQTTPPFTEPADLAKVVGLSLAEAEPVFDYFEQHKQAFSSHGQPRDTIPIYPAFYGQCLRYHLREHLPEDQALSVFAKTTGYPVLTDTRHICRNCVGSCLVPAAHTLEHLVALRYPMVALGDSQDLGFTTNVLHPHTQGTTVFLYDNYDGGIGAAEKIFSLFDTLLHKALESLDCECNSDQGCPLCTQTLQCDRRTEALSKIAARGLIHLLLDMPIYVPLDPLYWTQHKIGESEREAETREFAKEPVPTPEQPGPPSDPFWLLRVQPHVHDRVLDRALHIRGEEISSEVPPASVSDLQTAYQIVAKRPRESSWHFPDGWSEHEVLHIHPEASKPLASAAYKIIVRYVHPDRNPKRVDWATEATKRVNIAWEAVQANWAQPGFEYEDDEN